MKIFLTKVRTVAVSHAKALTALFAVAAVGAYTGTAGASGTIITSAFTTEAAQILVYFGLAAGIVVVGLGFGVGLKFLVKWVKFAFGRGS